MIVILMKIIISLILCILLMPLIKAQKVDDLEKWVPIGPIVFEDDKFDEIDNITAALLKEIKNEATAKIDNPHLVGLLIATVEKKQSLGELWKTTKHDELKIIADVVKKFPSHDLESKITILFVKRKDYYATFKIYIGKKRSFILSKRIVKIDGKWNSMKSKKKK
jgi:hypothetical protein